MTIIMLLIAMTNRTPVSMWMLAMSCDTAMIIVYLLKGHIG